MSEILVNPFIDKLHSPHFFVMMPCIPVTGWARKDQYPGWRHLNLAGGRVLAPDEVGIPLEALFGPLLRPAVVPEEDGERP